MSRFLRVVSALLLCVSLVQLSDSCPISRCGCDHGPAHDDCDECGFIRLAEEQLLPLPVVQSGAACYQSQPLPYQVQVPVPQATHCGQQFGYRVEHPVSSHYRVPHVHTGYEVETPCAPIVSKLPPLPVSVTACAPKPCQSVHVNYEVETPCSPCSARLTNLKTQVDRLVLPCHCPPPINDWYVSPESPSERCKRSTWCQCDCGGDSFKDTDDFVDDQSSSRSRCRSRNRPYPRPVASTRVQFFPNSRTDQSPRANWLSNRVDRNDIEELEDAAQDGRSSVTEWPETTQEGDERIVSRASDYADFADYYDDYSQPDQERSTSSGTSPDPVGNRLRDPNFGNRQRSNGNRRQLNQSDSSSDNRTLIDSLLSTVRTNPQNTGGRTQSSHMEGMQGANGRRPHHMRQNYSGQNRGMRYPPTQRGFQDEEWGMDTNDQGGYRRQGSSQENRITTPQTNRQGGSQGQQERVKTPKNNRYGGPQRQGSDQQDRITTPNTDRQGGSQRQGNGQQDRITTPNTDRQGGSQRQGNGQQDRITTPNTDRQGGSQRQGNGQQDRITTPNSGRQGGSQRQGSDQQDRITSNTGRQGGNQMQRSPHIQNRITNRGGGYQRQGNPQEERTTTPIIGGQVETEGQQRRPNQQTQQQTPQQNRAPSHQRPAGPQKPKRRRRPNKCNACTQMRNVQAPVVPESQSFAVQTPENTVTFTDYIDLPFENEPISGPLVQPFNRQAGGSPPEPSPQPSLGPGYQGVSNPGRNPISPQDTSRIVTPTTYAESRLNNSDYNDLYYYYDYY